MQETVDRTAELIHDYGTGSMTHMILDTSSGTEEQRIAENSKGCLSKAFTSRLGTIYQGDSSALMRSRLRPKSVDLIMTSPPYALERPKEYGNERADGYLDWFRQFAEGFRRVLKPTGSLVIDIGGAWNKGIPTRSLYHFELLIMLCREYGFHLAQEFYWWNPSKLPTPTEWVNVRRVRVKDAVNTVWWLSLTPYPKASNRRVLQPYSPSMENLLKNGYDAKVRPSGHAISSRFQVNNGGAIPPNLLAVANTESNSAYQRFCRSNGLLDHPARFPAALPGFFIRMLTDPGDRVLDPFAGSCVTGEVAEQMGRRWTCCEIEEEYVRGALGRFAPSPALGPGKTAPYQIYPPNIWSQDDAAIPLVPDGGQARPDSMIAREAEQMKLGTRELHSALLDALGDRVLSHSDIEAKPIELDLRPPLPPRLRVYLYTLTSPSGARTIGEHKIQVILPNQRRGERRDFDDSGERIVLLMGYDPTSRVFVLWDASMYANISFSRNVQVKPQSVYAAMNGTIVEQQRFIRGQGREIILTATTESLVSAILRRMELTQEKLVSAE